MILPFKLELFGEPTYFVEKIWQAIQQHQLVDKMQIDTWRRKLAQRHIDISQPLTPKLHTIREDAKGRWTPGRRIHPVIHNRTPNHFQFAPSFLVVSIQTIRVEFEALGEEIDRMKIFVDDRQLSGDEIITLALNDGFAGGADLWKFFAGINFTGKIIHWTDLKY